MKRTAPNSEMPFLDHLEELRQRLFWIIGAVIVGFAIGLLIREQLAEWSIAPVQKYLQGQTLQILSPMDGIMIPFQLAFYCGLIIASPVIFYQLWAFVAPALYKNEKRIGVYVMLGGFLLFLAGAALAFFFVLPATLRFAVDFAGPAFRQDYAARDYYSMLVGLLLTFGIAFELPLVIMALSALGLVTPSFLRTYRRHAMVLCVVGACLVTPGDMVTATIALVGPLYLLYELGILLSVLAHRWRQRRENSGSEVSPPPEPA